MSGCPKRVLNGPCGGMKPDGSCELGDRQCIFSEKYPSKVILDHGFRFRPEIRRRQSFTKLLAEVEERAVWIAEIPPSAKAFDDIELLRGLSFTALSVPENPLARLHIEPAVFAQLLKERLGCELMIHLTCRDLSRLAIKSRILAMGLCGLEHVLALTGDHPKLGREESAPVFDLDSIRLIYLARIMSDYGVDELGNKLQLKPRIQVGAGLNPYLPLDIEVSRTLRKLEAGAEFFVTQLIFDAEPVKRALGKLRESGVNVPVFIGFLVAEDEVIRKTAEIIGIPGADIPLDPEKLIEKYLEAVEELRRLYGPVGAFVSTLGRIGNFKLWDRAFRSYFMGS
ncbi:MAG: methylenetetrahydrofolate reductase C-terminal domain-containing protein [Nitrososphaerota archaeon]